MPDPQLEILFVSRFNFEVMNYISKKVKVK